MICYHTTQDRIEARAERAAIAAAIEDFRADLCDGCGDEFDAIDSEGNVEQVAPVVFENELTGQRYCADCAPAARVEAEADFLLEEFEEAVVDLQKAKAQFHHEDNAFRDALASMCSRRETLQRLIEKGLAVEEAERAEKLAPGTPDPRD